MMTLQELLDLAGKIRDDAFQTHGQESQESILRATVYAIARIHESRIRDEQELRNVWAAFADGFCTGRGHGERN